MFSAPNIEVPANYSQVAADIIAQKYFRKAGIPAYVKKIEENDDYNIKENEDKKEPSLITGIVDSITFQPRNRRVFGFLRSDL